MVKTRKASIEFLSQYINLGMSDIKNGEKLVKVVNKIENIACVYGFSVNRKELKNTLVSKMEKK